MTSLTLGTRGSALARTQTGMVADMLRARGHDVRIEVLVTRGDREQHAPVPALGGKGLFTAELEAALLAGTIEGAVHSLKDLPTEETEGLVIAAVPRREDARDALVARGGMKFADLPRGARVGTASLRRIALLRSARPDLQVVPLRGNVDTRLGKVASGEMDAVLLAAAGLKRLGRADAITDLLDFLPAPAQGALAVQARADRPQVVEAIHALHDRATADCVAAERAMLRALGGGCSVPVGALATARGALLGLRGLVAATDGSRVIRAEAEGDDPVRLGEEVARRLIEQGAGGMLHAPA